MSKNASQPRQKSKAAFKNAAAKQKLVAIAKSVLAPRAPALVAIKAKPKPTSWANCGGRISSVLKSPERRGLTNFL